MPSESSSSGQAPIRDVQNELAATADFPVVGIGASAGGGEALLAFSEHAPAPTGLALVVILHLPSAPVSHVDEVLQRTARLPVTQVTSATPIGCLPCIACCAIRRFRSCMSFPAAMC